MVLPQTNQIGRKRKLRPIVRELSADLETPVSVFLKVGDRSPSYLLESVSGGEQLARYSFIGIQPRSIYVLHSQSLEIFSNGAKSQLALQPGEDPLDALRRELAAIEYEPAPGLPRFAGGFVGYLGYEAIHHIEPTVTVHDHPTLPQGIFLLSDTLIAFDHAFGRLLLIANVEEGQDNRRETQAAEDRLDEIQARLEAPIDRTSLIPAAGQRRELTANMSPETFKEGVLKAKSHIEAGDIFQVVLSQRLSRPTDARPFDIYRALRRTNPSPYMFYFDFGTLNGHPPFRIIGASPEMHVRLENQKASLRPIAGTRKRGLTQESDEKLEEELRADPKELAEHVMLVDLARNDLGRVCRFGTVQVSEQLSVERYSHVMHLVSHVEGEIEPEIDAFDLMKATFPAGTVSGAPKVRAMQIISDIEGAARGPYAGAVGYFSYDGSMDTCITIRTLIMEGKQVSVQAGAGIVADSDPDNEYLETINKAQALAEAVSIAEAIQNGSGRNSHDSGH